jgi:polyphenol oxidase
MDARCLSLAAGPASGAVVRQDINDFQLDSNRVSVLEAAIREMQDRSIKNANDPKGWLANANAHRDFCATPGLTDPNQIHFCWWFLPWHRAFIAVTERKLREISGDNSVAFPYWNWSTDRRIPVSFARAGSPLSNAVRYTPDRKIRDPEVDYFPTDPGRAKLGVAALGAKAYLARKPAEIGESFGGIARPNPDAAYDNNRLEGIPHGPIHNYVGGANPATNAPGDMTDFKTAARDPIFFSHHGNLDRLWEIWRSDPKKKATEPDSDTFLKHPFAFTWIDGKSMTVTVEETLDTRRLGYVYDSLEVFRPTVAAQEIAAGDRTNLPPIARETLAVPSVPLEAGQAPARYILTISGVEKPDRPMTVGVFLKPRGDQSDQPGVAAGSFAAVQYGGKIQLSNELRFDVTDAISKLGSPDVTVSLIPYSLGSEAKYPYPPLKFEKMSLVPTTE